ncbi:class I SAM-dependent methyltransferase [Micromonospora endophytica]|uniref:SAM-dependent methyltransferase n=1 Tax=Micromonospora endophytica TaxID=515350 RepID=A0A2W2CKM3_9ACTN|nr:class I SAM-dependent methyltransferase [Micromonospora endophytica]PZF98490.1 SAM-dependent methyltransferase [Micromonospora endophytica]RIW46024.1 class I SAM-dependent methyltransferase [Micromonospora endophytica]
MDVAQVFDAVAGDYDAPRRRLVPCFDGFYGTAVEVAEPPLRAALAAGRTPDLLDLGAGTGLLSSLLATAVPEARLTLVDAAPKMLAVAAERLTARDVAHRVVVADLADPLPAGRYDAVVSALAIHHLDDAGKRELYRRVAGVLRPGGVFVNAEQVAGPTPELDRRYHQVWLAQVAALGSDAAEIAAAEQRMSYDRPAPVAEQCRWLTEAGLVEVDCFFKAWRFAVFGGRAPEGSEDD